MSKIFQSVVLPLHRLLSGRNILPYFKAAQVNQWLSHDRLVRIQSDGIRRLMAHAAAQVPFYQKRFSQTGITPEDIRRADDLNRIPPLTKGQLRRHREDLIAVNFRRKDLVARSTGGSTGVPTSFFYDRGSWDARVGAKYSAYTWAGWDFPMPTAILSGSPIDKAVFLSLRGKLKSALFHELVLDTFQMSEPIRRTYIRRLQRFRPGLLIGYTSACIALARQFIADGQHLAIPSIITSAEMLFPEQRSFLEDAFESEIFDLYGSREVSAIGMECNRHIGFHVPIDRLVVEILHGDTPTPPGEPGEITITDLENFGMPLIRYQIGDVGRFLDGECPCGRKLPLLELTHGRICDLIITPSGRYLPGEFFPHLFKEVSAHVEQYQIIQQSLAELIIKIVANDSFGDSQRAYLEKKIREKVGLEMEITFQMVKEIPPETSGKHRITISKLDHSKPFEEPG